ncbi:SMP-30/gluconolactonase/LRE family protein [Streptacidiphilus sp. MAP5-3]|uniref:SMP-30/gluconolactonase/LRE family protein n=1 Tax=unclassified Streptacidiphilus TaxID=2643834 RepID=UPI003514A394
MTGTELGNATARWRDRLELGEGARWVDGRLVLVDILAGRLLADSGGERLNILAALDVPLGAVAAIHGSRDTWIAAAGTGVCIIPGTGAVTWLSCPEEHAHQRMRMNDAIADPSGRLWVGSMAYDTTDGAGSLYRVDRDGTVSKALNGVTIPNGPAFTDDGTTMYLADSARRSVHRFRVDPATGALSERELLVDLTGSSGQPDGMTVDREGGVWIALWGAGAVHRYLPDGTLDRVVELPATQPTSVCLGGADGRLLHITTASYGLRAPGPHDGAVLTVTVEIPGSASASFRAEAPVAAILDAPAGPGARMGSMDGQERHNNWERT